MESSRVQGALFESFAAVAKGLAHPKRLEIVELLAQGPRPVDAIATQCGLQVTTASAQLQVLHRAGLVARQRDGAHVVYRLAGDDIAGLLSTLSSVAARHRVEVELTARGLLDPDGEGAIVQVDRDRLLARVRAGEVTVLDVRPSTEFEAGHLPGAVSIPLDELPGRLDELPPETEIVAYCRGAHCVMSHDAARLLRQRGREVAVLDEGVVEWRASGRPLSVA